MGSVGATSISTANALITKFESFPIASFDIETNSSTWVIHHVCFTSKRLYKVCLDFFFFGNRCLKGGGGGAVDLH